MAFGIFLSRKGAHATRDDATDRSSETISDGMTLLCDRNYVLTRLGERICTLGFAPY